MTNIKRGRMVQAMLTVIRDGKTWAQRCHYDSMESGPFVVEQQGCRLGQLRLHMRTRGAYTTPAFVLERAWEGCKFASEEDWYPPFYYELRRGDPGYAVVLREFGRRYQNGSLFKEPEKHGRKGRMPVWHCYLPQHHT